VADARVSAAVEAAHAAAVEHEAAAADEPALPLPCVPAAVAAEQLLAAAAADEPVLPLPCALVAVAAEQSRAAVAADEPEHRHVHLAAVVARAAPRVQPAALPHVPFAAVHVVAFVAPAQRVAPLHESQREVAALALQVAAAVSEPELETSAVHLCLAARLSL